MVTTAGTTRTAGADAAVREIALEGFKGAYGSLSTSFRSDPIWASFRDLGSMLWLDTGDLDEVKKLWTREFTHMTTNNTLVNKEVQKGQFDELIPRAAARLREEESGIDENRLVQEIGFILNCRVALRLIDTFDAHVSVELPPVVAHDVDASMALARRYYAVCPERFLIKVPLTPAGYITVRRLASEAMPINFTLGFSARQNFLAALISRPQFVNVFMGRLNSFVADNGLGDGKLVGEKATLASQQGLWLLRDEGINEETRQIGASTREAQQVIDLAGIDVFTLPPKVATALHDRLAAHPEPLACCAERTFNPSLAPGAESAGLSALWDMSEEFQQMARLLSADAPALETPDSMLRFLDSHGFGNMFHTWTEEETRQLFEDGKIPKLARWKDRLASGEIALDDLMSNSALQSFAHDQKELDDRVRKLLRA